jgi:hypothetical protein
VQGANSTEILAWTDFAVDIAAGSRIAVRENILGGEDGSGRFIVHLFG